MALRLRLSPGVPLSWGLVSLRYGVAQILSSENGAARYGRASGAAEELLADRGVGLPYCMGKLLATPPARTVRATRSAKIRVPARTMASGSPLSSVESSRMMAPEGTCTN